MLENLKKGRDTTYAKKRCFVVAGFNEIAHW